MGAVRQAKEKSVKRSEGAAGRRLRSQEGNPIACRLDEINSDLSDFLVRNPEASIESFKEKNGATSFRIVKPWGDESVSIVIPEVYKDLADALNKVFLPERLTALWHVDTRKLEIIWTALKLPADQREIFGRKFLFHFNGVDRECEFAASSERLVKIAENTFPRGISLTNHRNIQSFYTYSRLKANERDAFAIDDPKSFWISDIDWNENDVISLINNLNFFLTYYDDISPTIVVHTPKPVHSAPSRRTRYMHGAFPEKIFGRGLNDNLLSFWLAANSGNPVMRFILYYRIIEYASHHYVEEKVRLDLKRLLSMPHATSNLTENIEKIIDIISAKKNDEIPKFKSIVNSCVSPKLVWREIEIHSSFFQKETKFEGGFSIKALLSNGDREQSFCEKGLDSLCDHFRKIRNALSHGRDQETGGVISPTTLNFQLLHPWVHLISTAAGEVVLYKDVT